MPQEKNSAVTRHFSSLERIKNVSPESLGKKYHILTEKEQSIEN